MLLGTGAQKTIRAISPVWVRTGQAVKCVWPKALCLPAYLWKEKHNYEASS